MAQAAISRSFTVPGHATFDGYYPRSSEPVTCTFNEWIEANGTAIANGTVSIDI